MKHRIPYTKPSITELEVAYATDAARNGWGEHCYEYINRFETLFKEHLGVKYAIATSSCTGALHMGLAALGIGYGDEVILADTNWIATVAPVVHLGATPVFIDIMADTWCIDTQKIESAITKRTKAIIAVHLYGNLCDMDILLALGEKYGIPIIEDAAEAIGSEYRGRRAGAIGKFGTFSFHGTKTITTGEGGMFVTNDPNLYEQVLTASNHGRTRSELRQFWPEVIGFKYKISNVQAAIGCAQVQRVSELIKRKRDIFSFYKEGLQHLSCLKLNPELPFTKIGAWMPTVVFDRDLGIGQDALIRAFAQENIDARVFFHPLTSLAMFSRDFSHLNSYDLPKRAINLPSYHDMTDEEQTRIVKTVVSLI